MIRLFFTEPAFTEATLACILGFFVTKRGQTYDYSTRMFSHQNKSLSLIRTIIDQPKKLYDYSLFWTVVLNMVTNQESGDWVSFEINFRGLQQIIALLGGRDVLRCKNYRAYIFSEGMCTASRALTIEPPMESAISSATPPAQQQTLVKNIISSTRAVEISEGLLTLFQMKLIGNNIASCLSEAIQILRQSRQGEVQGTEAETQKYIMQSALLEYLEGRCLRFAEYTLCLGLLLKLVCTPPFGYTRRVLYTGQKAFLLVSTFRDMVMADMWEVLRAPVLWTCLAIMGMHVDAGLSFNVRLSLLQPTILEISNQQPLWRNIRGPLDRIYLDAELEILWSKTWEMIVHT